uniref:Uncharacterized protein n=1 Tax=Sphaerodactylus townsendi TaxID=933632 RepID=A0ACB8FTH0_9SAUR
MSSVKNSASSSNRWLALLTEAARQAAPQVLASVAALAAGDRQPVGAAGDGASAVGASVGAVAAPPSPDLRQRELKATLNSNLEVLPYFLAQVGSYMRAMSDEFENDAEQVYESRLHHLERQEANEFSSRPRKTAPSCHHSATA